jgi:hypothetical protein
MLPLAKCLRMSDRTAKYCIYGSYLIAIQMSKIQCVER